MATEKDVVALADQVWGAANDSALWDGWRTYGTAWALRYLRGEVRRGAEIRAVATPEQRAALTGVNP